MHCDKLKISKYCFNDKCPTFLIYPPIKTHSVTFSHVLENNNIFIYFICTDLQCVSRAVCPMIFTHVRDSIHCLLIVKEQGRGHSKCHKMFYKEARPPSARIQAVHPRSIEPIKVLMSHPFTRQHSEHLRTCSYIEGF